LPVTSSAVPDEWYYASVDLANDLTTIAAVPCLIGGWNVTVAMSAQPCLIKDDTTSVLAIPASSAVAAFRDIGRPIRTTTNLVVDPDNAATGTVTIVYRILSQP
jgi:hypothetical protein